MCGCGVCGNSRSFVVLLLSLLGQISEPLVVKAVLDLAGETQLPKYFTRAL
jgi:hypothetical protein